jgi:SAM-dependent methyltransferase
VAASWYYRIELSPGVFTDGKPRPNVALTRDFLRHIDLSGTTCLDIGSQDFVVPVLLKRQGATTVVAYDRLSLTQHWEQVKQSYEVDFDYVHGIPLNELKQALRDQGKPESFDVVVFSGVLYHMIDPLAGLAMARSFVRSGGLLVIETSVKLASEHILEFNAGGKLYAESNYFQVSIATLDYWIRMLRMAPIDAALFRGAEASDIRRCGIVGRATEGVEADPDDSWMRGHFLVVEFEPYGLRYEELASSAPPVPYRSLEGGSALRAGTQSIDVPKTLAARPVYRPDKALQDLKLSDGF